MSLKKGKPNKVLGGIMVGLLICPPLWANQNLTWVDCLQKASEYHPDLITAKEGIRQSRDAHVITSSSLWPHAQADLSVTQNQASGSGKSTSYAYGVSGSQLLFDSFKTTNNIQASNQDIKASQANFQYVSSLVRLRLRTAFINLLKAQELIQLTRKIFDIRKQSLALITKFYNSGMEHKGALLTTQANLAESEFEMHQAIRELEVAQRNLLKEIGAKTIEPIEIEGSFDVGGKYQQSPDFEMVVNTNPQLLQLMAQRNAASFNVKSDQSDFWPSVSLTGGVGKSAEHWPPSVVGANVGLGLSWPLLEGGARTAQLDKDKSILRGLDAQVQSLKDSLVLNLEQSWTGLQDAMEQLDVQKKFLMADEERAKIAEKQYSVGLLSYDNWIIIEDNLVNSKKTFLNTQANALLAEANWIAAQGRTLEYAH